MELIRALVIVFAYFTILMGTMYMLDMWKPMDDIGKLDTNILWAIFMVSAVYFTFLWVWSWVIG